jgi:hypothetical protein
MNPLALAIQRHENAAGRPMDDLEASVIGAMKFSKQFTNAFFVDGWIHHWHQDFLANLRCAYAAGIKAGKAA